MSDERTMVEALNLALREEMDRDDNVMVLGEDVGADGGIFRVTKGLIDDFGESRVMDTPLAEAGIVGVSVGMALAGLNPVAEMQFSGFSYFAFHQIEGHVARMRWRSRGRFTLPLVIRMPFGGGVRALEHHSESREAYFAHTPGLRTVIPSGPRNACTLLKAAIRSPDPVIFLEPKAAYRAFREEVPEGLDPAQLDKADIRRKGADITMISYGAMLRRTLEAAETLAEEDGVEAEVIDLPTLAPLDAETIGASVRRTGRAVVVTEAPLSFGPAGEIAARIAEEAFVYLEAPVNRVTGWDVPMPFFAREQSYLPDARRITNAARVTLAY
ncbi:alpha-ketoacid dehydrogenase subunit beta [Pseudokordiimonas caeni]|uniref:alpha-ketoacid dehydrogenase subunit beta n=1 Tax=Pseudokordiimonas caeni TaxID=2997908 RepID=UPI002811D178|nr:alpha-ketoacid dehydrogenase subunit beta [Pseudokordiimonas caeni]